MDQIDSKPPLQHKTDNKSNKCASQQHSFKYVETIPVHGKEIIRQVAGTNEKQCICDKTL